MDVRVRVDDAAAREALKEVRRDANRAMRDGLVDAAETTVLPKARAFAPRKTGKLAASLVVRRSGSRVYLTTGLNGKEARRVGLLEFGGTVRSEIRPKRKRSRRGRGRPAALAFGGRFVSRVTTPRRYRGRHFMTRGVEAGLPGFTRQAAKSVLVAFRNAGFDTSGEA